LPLAQVLAFLPLRQQLKSCHCQHQHLLNLSFSPIPLGANLLRRRYLLAEEVRFV
jgi:hypothetical protein